MRCHVCQSEYHFAAHCPWVKDASAVEEVKAWETEARAMPLFDAGNARVVLTGMHSDIWVVAATSMATQDVGGASSARNRTGMECENALRETV